MINSLKQYLNPRFKTFQTQKYVDEYEISLNFSADCLIVDQFM